MNELSHQVFVEKRFAKKQFIVKQDEVINNLIIIASGQVQISKTIIYIDAKGKNQKKIIQLLNLNKGDIISGECLNLENEEDESVIKSDYNYQVISREGVRLYNANIFKLFKIFGYSVPDLRVI